MDEVIEEGGERVRRRDLLLASLGNFFRATQGLPPDSIGRNPSEPAVAKGDEDLDLSHPPSLAAIGGHLPLTLDSEELELEDDLDDDDSLSEWVTGFGEGLPFDGPVLPQVINPVIEHFTEDDLKDQLDVLTEFLNNNGRNNGADSVRHVESDLLPPNLSLEDIQSCKQLIDQTKDLVVMFFGSGKLAAREWTSKGWENQIDLGIVHLGTIHGKLAICIDGVGTHSTVPGHGFIVGSSPSIETQVMAAAKVICELMRYGVLSEATMMKCLGYSRGAIANRLFTHVLHLLGSPVPVQAMSLDPCPGEEADKRLFDSIYAPDVEAFWDRLACLTPSQLFYGSFAISGAENPQSESAQIAVSTPVPYRHRGTHEHRGGLLELLIKGDLTTLPTQLEMLAYTIREWYDAKEQPKWHDRLRWAQSYSRDAAPVSSCLENPEKWNRQQLAKTFAVLGPIIENASLDQCIAPLLNEMALPEPLKEQYTIVVLLLEKMLQANPPRSAVEAINQQLDFYVESLAKGDDVLSEAQGLLALVNQGRVERIEELDRGLIATLTEHVDALTSGALSMR